LTQPTTLPIPERPNARTPERLNSRTPDYLTREIARRAFLFFQEASDPHTGLTKDRARLNGGDRYTVASIAATGYALTALPIGVENGWISREQARQRALVTLRFLGDGMPQVHGWYYHFVDMRTGERVWNCELSSIDTALLLAGVIAVRQYWPRSELSRRADALLARVDWPWMLADGGAKPAELTLCMGWKPESGYLKSRWGAYCEHMLLYLLGLGAPRHPLPATSWSAWSREIEKNEGYEVIAPGPIFMHQMTQGYIDLRDRRDRLGYDYWQNSINAHLANAAFCARHEAEFASYRGGMWGLNASDTPDGYGTREPHLGRHDGTLCPTGAAAGLPFVPELAERAIGQMEERYGSHLWGRYGFADAFNADRDWWGPDVIGIDLGMALVSIEDARTGFVWRLMAGSSIIRRGLRAAGFHRTSEPRPRRIFLPPVPETRQGPGANRLRGLNCTATATAGSMTTGNSVMFHPSKGTGYRFVVSQRWEKKLTVD
jgi:hypothetical protein